MFHERVHQLIMMDTVMIGFNIINNFRYEIRLQKKHSKSRFRFRDKKGVGASKTLHEISR